MWFYWKKRSTEGYMAVLDTNPPGKNANGQKPKLLRPAVELTADQLHMTLDDCIEAWPQNLKEKQ